MAQKYREVKFPQDHSWQQWTLTCWSINASSLPSPGQGSLPGWQFLCWTTRRLAAQLLKNTLAVHETLVQPWVRKIPWRGKGYPLQYSVLENSMGLQRVRHDRVTHFTSLQPIWQYILLLACLFYISFLHCRNISQINDLHGSLCLRLCSFGEARLIQLVPRTARLSG